MTGMELGRPWREHNRLGTSISIDIALPLRGVRSMFCDRMRRSMFVIFLSAICAAFAIGVARSAPASVGRPALRGLVRSFTALAQTQDKGDQELFR